jgi:HTH-type transcriptional regulator / antitoxin HigA
MALTIGDTHRLQTRRGHGGSPQISPVRYGKLLAKALPKVIETDEEFNRYVEMMEQLDRRHEMLSAEEQALLALLERLVKDYDDKFELPDVSPREVVKILMEHRGLRQADLVAVIGSRAQVSEIVNGKRGISKAQARKLAGYFQVSIELFI